MDQFRIILQAKEANLLSFFFLIGFLVFVLRKIKMKKFKPLQNVWYQVNLNYPALESISMLCIYSYPCFNYFLAITSFPLFLLLLLQLKMSQLHSVILYQTIIFSLFFHPLPVLLQDLFFQTLLFKIFESPFKDFIRINLHHWQYGVKISQQQ